MNIRLTGAAPDVLLLILDALGHGDNAFQVDVDYEDGSSVRGGELLSPMPDCSSGPVLPLRTDGSAHFVLVAEVETFTINLLP